MRDYNKCRQKGHKIVTTVVQIRRQTHFDPAEYEEVEYCTVCDEEQERDWDVERDIRDGF